MTLIKGAEERKSAAKNIKPSQVDFNAWDGKIQPGTSYGTLAKTICLNAIKVSLDVNFLFYFQLSTYLTRD